MRISSFVFVLGNLFAFGDSANILVLCPYEAHSHTIGLFKIGNELWAQGHNLTVASLFSKNEKRVNYTSISLSSENDGSVPLFPVPDDTFDTWAMILDFYFYVRPSLVPVIANERLRRLKEEKFDLVIMEYFVSDMAFALVHGIDAPLILVHTTEAYPWQNELFGEPHSESFISHSMSNEGEVKTFGQRFWNLVEIYGIVLAHRLVFAVEDQKDAEAQFGRLPLLRDIGRRASLFFVNTHYSISIPRPRMPSTIEIGGIHISPPKALPHDIQKILDESKGAIFFSLGSVMKGSTLPDNIRDAILNVFGELNETVLWKFEGELHNKSPNVHVSRWFPQRDILAHPNVVLFIAHCGILGMQESVHEAVPLMCIPFFADQFSNAQFVQDSGMGLRFEFKTIDEDKFRRAVHKVLKTPSFKENAQRVSDAFRDRPLSPMATAVYWIEYVLRHKGAPLLQSQARYMTWIEYNNVDVALILVVLISLLLYCLYKVLYSIIFMLLKRRG